ncbi:MAG: hypothetical protein ACWGNK_03085, partial [Desulfobacterales bacterium]
MKTQKRFFPILLHLSALLISLFTLVNNSFAETYVSGNITSDTTWDAAGSPYIVTGDITVRHSAATHYNIQTAAVLTIEPGVVVRFEPGTGLYIGLNNTGSSTYDYYGALSAQGTADEPVVFTSNSP